MSSTALLVIDMLNDYRHPDAEQLADSVSTIIDPLAGLISEASTHSDIDLIYVNDNRGDFTADYDSIIAGALDGPRADLVTPVIPAPDWLRLIKVRHSVFYSTSLDYLLRRLETSRLILTRQVTEQGILYSALDGYIRHYDVVVVPDAVAHIDSSLGEAALAMMERNMRAQLLEAAQCLT